MIIQFDRNPLAPWQFILVQRPYNGKSGAFGPVTKVFGGAPVECRGDPATPSYQCILTPYVEAVISQ